ncbi:uncharacterized protein IUM83_16076 [Phytophthora cinnamomi]|uniref:uncharacterized protein n=1 Tax=Phytophthora cinnamomi TaxID=4785 RepID=UPI00355A2343|nr:hypothetical protein IUM83_16076 [Phytophthora cinnamomi]
MSPMSFALHLREIDCVRFDAPPVVLMAQYSGRLGSRNLTVMNIRSQSELEQLEKGSSNANFYVDFGAGATLPVTDARWPTYEDLLAGIGGPISSGDMVWYDHAHRLLLRVKRFVLTNMERDNNTPVCATLTLMLVNQFINRILAHLLVDTPHWCRRFCGTVRMVDYHGANSHTALNGLALRMATTAAPATSGQLAVLSRQPSGHPRRGPATGTPTSAGACPIPDPVMAASRAAFPRWGVCVCYGGSSNCCTHRWEAVSLESCLASLTTFTVTSAATQTTFTVTSAATQTTVTVPEAAEVAPVRRHFGIRVVPCYR